MTPAQDALAAIDLVVAGGFSLTLAGGAGPVADALLARLAARRELLRMPATVEAAALEGGLDALATVAAGQAVHRRVLPERLHGRVLVVAGAERASPALAARLAGWLDDGALPAGLVLLDESIGEEALPAALAERSAMRVEMDGVRLAEVTTAPAGASPPAASPPAAMPETAALLVEVAARFGIGSPRPVTAALRVARAAGGDVALAARLCLAPRARHAPPPAPPPAPPEAADPLPPAEDAATTGGTVDQLVEAVRTALPPGLIAGSGPGRAGGGGSATARRGEAARGRPGRLRREAPGRGCRLDLVATLTAAAPHQRQRGRITAALVIRRDDLRVRRRQPRQRHATIIAVDASGSAAMARLGEVKGAVEQLLARSYIRRDEVALLAFRAAGAETLLPPTRSLARAQRELAALPGGGATPLAAGILAGLDQTLRSRTAGRSTLLVLMTDGGANIGQDGTADRVAARRDALAAAHRVALAGVDALVVDASPRGAAPVRALAEAMGARYLALPRPNDLALSAAIGHR